MRTSRAEPSWAPASHLLSHHGISWRRWGRYLLLAGLILSLFGTFYSSSPFLERDTRTLLDTSSLFKRPTAEARAAEVVWLLNQTGEGLGSAVSSKLQLLLEQLEAQQEAWQTAHKAQMDELKKQRQLIKDLGKGRKGRSAREAEAKAEEEKELASDWEPKADEKIAEALAAAATTGHQVFLTFISGVYNEMLVNLVTSMERVGIARNLMVVAFDIKSAGAADELGDRIGAVYHAYEDPLVTGGKKQELAGMDDFFSKEYKALVNLRYGVLLRCLEQKYHIFHIDVDVWFLQNPFYYLTNDYDLQIQSDARRGFAQDQYKPVLANGGVHYTVASKRSLAFWREVADLVTANPDTIDQYLLNPLLAEYKKPFHWRPLDPLLFPNGAYYFETRVNQALGVKPFLVHNNWITGNRNKVYRFREANMWAVDPPEYLDTSQRKFLTYFGTVEDNGLAHSQRELRDALAIAAVLERTLVLPRFHAVYLEESPVAFDFLYDYGSLEEQFPDIRAHSFLNAAFPKWGQGEVEFIILAGEEPKFPSDEDLAKRLKRHWAAGSEGATERELREWFGGSKEPLLVLYKVYGRFQHFEDPQLAAKFQQAFRKSLVVHKYCEFAELASKGSGFFDTGYNCLHVRRGNEYLAVQKERDVPMSRLATMAASYLPRDEPLYVATDTPTAELRDALQGTGYTEIAFLDDVNSMRDVTSELDGRHNLRHALVDSMICEKAKVFVGDVHSAFTLLITSKRRLDQRDQPVVIDLFGDDVPSDDLFFWK